MIFGHAIQTLTSNIAINIFFHCYLLTMGCNLTILKMSLICLHDVGWLVGFVALHPKSTAMVFAGRSVHLATLFPGQA